MSNSVKRLVLVLMAVQTASVPLATKLYFGKQILSTSIAANAELVKSLFCLAVLYYQQPHFISYLHDNILGSPKETLRMLVLSLCYALQTNFLFMAMASVEPAVFQVLTQAKIGFTAFFAYIMLNRRFSMQQYIALAILTLGLISTQVSSAKPTSATVESFSFKSFIGAILILVAALLSGFASCFFEKMVKTPNDNLWMRNLQLSLFQLPFSMIIMYTESMAYNKPIFYDYNAAVMLVVVLQALGGIAVALTIKYADSILKVFATSWAILISASVSALFFNFQVTLGFVIGSCLVMFATYLYNRPATQKVEYIVLNSQEK